MYTPIFTQILFTIAKKWNQQRCSFADDWLKKMWQIYTVQYYSALQMNEILTFVTKWMHPKPFFLVK